MINAIRRRVNEDIVVLSDTLSKPKKYKQKHWNSKSVKYSQLLCPECRSPFTCIAFKKGLAKLLCGHWRGQSI